MKTYKQFIAEKFDTTQLKAFTSFTERMAQSLGIPPVQQYVDQWVAYNPQKVGFMTTLDEVINNTPANVLDQLIRDADVGDIVGVLGRRMSSQERGMLKSLIEEVFGIEE